MKPLARKMPSHNGLFFNRYPSTRGYCFFNVPVAELKLYIVAELQDATFIATHNALRDELDSSKPE